MFIETTHTPSGDENGESDSRCLASTRNNLRPVRGRKSGIDLHCAVQIAKQLTPRQGTKTLSLVILSMFNSRNNSRPVRGRKRAMGKRYGLLSGNNSRPVRGRKHTCIGYHKGSFRNNLRPVRGRKPAVAPLTISVKSKQLTPRQGTKTASCTSKSSCPK